jgi:hypothetical protein
VKRISRTRKQERPVVGKYGSEAVAGGAAALV